MPPTVGFVGLGTLGKPMAVNLARKGFELYVFDVRRDAMDELEALGAKAADGLVQLARASQFIFTMVRDAEQTEEVILRGDGLVAGMAEGSTLIVTSTVGRECILKLDRILKAKGCKLVDAPVSGSLPGAQAGTLSLMVGADETVLASAMPVLRAVASSIFRAGDPGAGQIAKIANNLVFCASVAALLEGLKLGVESGVDPATLRAIFRASSANNYALEHWEQLGPRWKGQLSKNQKETSLIYKDLRLALTAAAECSLHLPVGSTVADICGSGTAVGHDDVRI